MCIRDSLLRMDVTMTQVLLSLAEKTRKAAKIQKGSGESAKGSVGSISRAQLEEIAKTKLPDLNCTSVESAMRIIEGTARNMGVSISD